MDAPNKPKKKLALLVLAAGMGSRYGGIKQIDGFGPSGETCVRCCYATAPDLLVKAMDGMEAFVKKHRK